MDIYQNHPLAIAGSFGKEAAFGKESPVNLKWGYSVPEWFQSTPPERVGLNGEYDYFGLKKRVEAVFADQFTASELAQLSVTQRGRVVILQGVVPDAGVLRCLVDAASRVEGAIRVDTGWVTCATEVHSCVAV
ncbi:MAG: hypothetical protein ACFB0G_23225 [Leptolyngbyaceae cyanobacterium]